MNILVIGAVGFLGSHLVKKLNAMGHRVVGCDTEEVHAKEIVGKNIPFYSCDFAAQYGMASIFKTENIELVIQATSRHDFGNAVEYPMRYYSSNVLGNVFLMDVILKNAINKFIYISSPAVFGDPENMPITNMTPYSPKNPIGNTQMFVENMLESFRISNKLSYAVLRHTEITGLSEIENDVFIKNKPMGLIGDIIRYFIGEIPAVEIYGTSYDTIDHTAERDYIHVDDFCNACVSAIPKLALASEKIVCNVGMGRKYSVKEVISVAEKIFGIEIKTQEAGELPGEPSRSYFDTSKTRIDLDWYPKYDSLEEIFKTMLPYYSRLRK